MFIIKEKGLKDSGSTGEMKSGKKGGLTE